MSLITDTLLRLGAAFFFVGHALEGEFDVIGGKIAAVLEFHALAQLELERCRIDDAEALGQIRHDLHLGV